MPNLAGEILGGVNKVDLDGGIEVGPKKHFPHFHMLLTLDHYGYIHFDSLLELRLGSCMQLGGVRYCVTDATSIVCVLVLLQQLD